jgi:Family of unknown function (DUF5706)
LHQLSVLLKLPFAIAAGLLVGSYYCLYHGGFPNLKGGHSSNVYFKDIAARNESKFAEDYQKQSSEALRLDLLSQIWRNSEILTEKFRSRKSVVTDSSRSSMIARLPLDTTAWHIPGLSNADNIWHKCR